MSFVISRGYINTSIDDGWKREEEENERDIYAYIYMNQIRLSFTFAYLAKLKKKKLPTDRLSQSLSIKKKGNFFFRIDVLIKINLGLFFCFFSRFFLGETTSIIHTYTFLNRVHCELTMADKKKTIFEGKNVCEDQSSRSFLLISF